MTKPAATGKIENREIRDPAVLIAACRDNLQKNLPPFSGLSDKERQRLQERYSRFEDKMDEEGFVRDSLHLIHSPRTPRPYFHALHNSSFFGERFGTLWDQTGGGFSFLNAVCGGEIIRNSASPYKPLWNGCDDGRSFFLREETPTGRFKTSQDVSVEAWPIFASSSDEEKSAFRCEQSPTHIALHNETNGITADLRMMIPREENAERWELMLCNTTPRKRTLTLFIGFSWDLRSYPAPRLLRGEFLDVKADLHTGLLTASNADRSGLNPRTGFFIGEQRFTAFEFSGLSFNGTGLPGHLPKAVIDGKLCSRHQIPIGENCIVAVQYAITLKPKQTETLAFALGAVSGGHDAAVKNAIAFRSKYGSSKNASTSAKKNTEMFHSLADRFCVRTPDPEFNRFFNVWSTAQLLNTALFHSGAPKTEFREQMQILSVLGAFLPQETKTLLKNALCYQLKDGRILNRHSPFKLDTPEEEMSMDNAVWMAQAVCRYINETGDTAFLDEMTGFYDPVQRAVDDKKSIKIYDHIMAAIRCLFDYRGRFGLCKVGSRDYNAALVKIGKLGGISAWLSMALVRVTHELYAITRLRNQKRDVGYLNTILENMYSNLNNYSWNGVHYTYGYDDNGNPIGNKGDKAGAVHLSVNLWSLLCGAAKQGGNLDAVISIIDKLDTPLGHRSLAPCYPLGYADKGGIPDLLPGTFENGSIDAFNRAYAVLAFAENGLGDKAYETLKKGLPSSTFPDLSGANPNQISEFTLGPDHADFGRNLYDIYNPAISWLKLAMERMVGVIPVFDGLELNPSVPATWDEFTVRKFFRGKTYDVRFHNPEGKCCGIKKVTVNGRELEKNNGRYLLEPDKIAVAPKGKMVCVDVLMG